MASQKTRALFVCATMILLTVPLLSFLFCSSEKPLEMRLNKRQTDGQDPQTPPGTMAHQLASSGPPPMEAPMNTAAPTQLQQKVLNNSTSGKDTTFSDTNPASQCTSITVRKPWSKASKEQRQAFLQAQQCLMSKPGKWNKSGHQSHSMWEDISLLHNALSVTIHNSAILPPAHRVIVNTLWWLMTTKCGYKGDFYYLDIWTYADRNEVWTTQDLWSDDYYGTFEDTGTPGLFTDLTVHYSADWYDARILNVVNRPLIKSLRTVSTQGVPFREYMTSAFIEELLKKEDYWEWEHMMELTVHQYQHIAHGGDAIPSTSPISPFFYGIHSSIDALWSAYQEIDNGKNRFKYNGFRSDKTTASAHDSIPMMNVWSVDFNVEDMFDTRTKPNCYKYEFTGSFRTT